MLNYRTGHKDISLTMTLDETCANSKTNPQKWHNILSKSFMRQYVI
jgi:hypothetical protein